MLRQNCRALSPHLKKAVAVGGGYSCLFSSYSPSASFKTIFWAWNYEITKLLGIFV
jgi:hypothetical protein